jgi:hypothetical protein
VEKNLGNRLSEGLRREVLEFKGEWITVEEDQNGRGSIVPRNGQLEAKAETTIPQEIWNQPDMLFTVDIQGRTTVFAVEVKQAVHPTDVEKLLQKFLSQRKTEMGQHRFLVLSERLTKRAQEALRREGISYYDSSGNLCLFGSNFYFRKEGMTTTFLLETGDKAPFSLGSPKVGRVVRAILADGKDKSHGVRQLAAEVEIGVGYASTVLGALNREGYLRREGDVYHSDNLAELLDAWVSQPRRFAKGIHRYRVLQPNPIELEERIKAVCTEKGLRHAFSLWGAANRFASLTVNAMVAVYCDQPEEMIVGIPLSEKVERGENLWVMEPRDEGVYQFAQEVGGLTVVHPVQLYYDLMHAPHRGKGVAEMLREKFIGY